MQMSSRCSVRSAALSLSTAQRCRVQAARLTVSNPPPMAAAIQAELERITTDVAASVSAGADAADEPIAAPLSIVVFGATGDLAREKMYPSFRNLMVKGLLPYGSTIMACVLLRLAWDRSSCAAPSSSFASAAALARTVR